MPGDDKYIRGYALTPRSQGQLHDILTEIQRIEREMWGNPVDAAIMRCLAATRLKCDRPARITEIAHALNLGVATVHARLGRLKQAGPPGSEELGPAVVRTEGGYAETRAGRQRNDQCAERIAELVARLDVGLRVNRRAAFPRASLALTPGGPVRE